MLGVVGFAALCVLAALFPTATALVIFGVSGFYAVKVFVERTKRSYAARKGKQ
jgi:hypothetical protein